MRKISTLLSAGLLAIAACESKPIDNPKLNSYARLAVEFRQACNDGKSLSELNKILDQRDAIVPNSMVYTGEWMCDGSNKAFYRANNAEGFRKMEDILMPQRVMTPSMTYRK